MNKIGIVEGSFEWALIHLKNGSRIRRRNWKNKESFIYLTTKSKVKADNLRDDTKQNLFNNEPVSDEETITINAHIDMRVSKDRVCIGWVPEQIDMLSDDWELV